jgi:hypothetical protein
MYGGYLSCEIPIRQLADGMTTFLFFTFQLVVGVITAPLHLEVYCIGGLAKQVVR